MTPCGPGPGSEAGGFGKLGQIQGDFVLQGNLAANAFGLLEEIVVCGDQGNLGHMRGFLCAGERKILRCQHSAN